MIDKTSVIEPGAQLGKDVEIGPFCVIGKDVVLGDRVRLVSNVVIGGKTSIGDDTIIYPFAAIGMKGQDFKFQDDESMTGLTIGRRNRIREYATIQSGTPASKGTKIGDDCQIMVNAHIAHDCQLGNNIVLSNLVQLAGHVEIEDFVIVSAMSAVHQFCHIGAYAFLGGMSGTAVDIPPYVIFEGLPARYRTINRVGLARHGFTNEDMQAIYSVYNAVFESGAGEDNLRKIKKETRCNKYAENAIDFIKNRSNRGIMTSGKHNSYGNREA